MPGGAGWWTLRIASVIRDGLLRVSETVALAWADVAPAPDGSGIATVRRSKTDPESQGQAVYLGQAAMTALAAIRPADVDGAAPIFGLSVRQLPRRIQAMAAGRRFGRGLQRPQWPGGNGPGPDGRRRGAARADGGRSVAVAPDPGAVHPKASPGPGRGRQVLPGEERQLAAAERVTIKAVLRFPSIGGLWPNLAQGSLCCWWGGVAAATPPHQQHSSGAGATPATSSRIGAGPDGLTGR